MALRMDRETAERVRARFRDTATDLDGARGDLSGFVGALGAGTGEFSGEISSAADDFHGSWRAVYEVFSDSASLIAGNTNALYVDLMRLDDDYATAIDISATG